MEKPPYVTFNEDHPTQSNVQLLHYNSIVESPPPLSPANRSPSPELSKQLTKFNSKNSKTSEEGGLSEAEKELAKLINKFYKSQAREKFDALIKCFESKKAFPPKIYVNIKDFKFPPSANTSLSFPQDHEVTCLAVSPDDRYLTLGFDTGRITLWDTKKLQETRFVNDERIGGLFSVSALVIDFDNNLFSSGEDYRIQKWNLKDGECVQIMEVEVLIKCLSVSWKLLASGHADGQITLWNLDNSGKRRLEGHKGSITSVVLAKEADILYSSSEDKTIKIWNTHLGLLDSSLDGHSDFVTCLALSVDETALASGGNDNLIKVWDLSTKREKLRFEGHADHVSSLEFSPDGGLLVSSSYDKTIKVWNVKKQELKKTLDGHTERVKCLVVRRDGRKIFSAGPDSVRVWNFDKDYEKHLLPGHKDQVTAILVLPDSTRVISCDNEKKILVWDLVKVKFMQNLEGHHEVVRSMATNVEGSKLVTGDITGRIIVWESRFLTKIQDLQLFKAEIIMIRFFSSENSRFMASCITGEVKIFDTVANVIERSFDSLFRPMTASELTNDNAYFGACSKNRFNLFDFQDQLLEKPKEAETFNSPISVIRTTQNSLFLILGLESGTMKVFSLSSLTFIREIPGSPHKILTLELSKDDQTIIASFQDPQNSLRFFDLETGEQNGLEDNQICPVTSLVLTSDSAKIISTGGSSHSLKIIVLNKVKTKRIFKQHTKEVRALDISWDQTLLAAGSNDSSISIWDVKTFEFKNLLEGHLQKVLAVKFTRSDRKLVSGSADHTLKIWDLNTLTCLISLKKVGGMISDLALTNDGIRAVVSCHDGIVSVFDLTIKEKGKEILNQYKHENHVECVALSSKDEYIVSGDKGGIIKIYDLVRKNDACRFSAHKGSCNQVIVNSEQSGLKVFSCGADKEIKIWRVSSLFEVTLIEALKGHTNEVLAITINSLGTRLFSASKDKTILMWDLINLKQISELEGHNNAINALVVSSDGLHLFSGSDDKTVRVWNLRDSKRLPFMDGHAQPISRLVVTPDNNYLVSGGLDKVVVLWDLKTKKQVRAFTENDGKITGLGVTSDSKTVIVGTNGPTTRIFSLVTGEKIEEFKYDLATCFDLLLSRDNSRLYVGYSDSVIRIWNLLTKTVVHSFDGHRGFVLCLLVTNYETKLVTGSDDQTAIVWDTRGLQKPMVLAGHEREVAAVCLSQDERLLYTGSGDKNVIVWNFYEGTILKVLQDHNNPITSLVISPDGNVLVVGCAPLLPTAEKRKNIYTYGIYQDYKPLITQEINNKGCTALKFCQTQGILFSADRDKNIMVYDFNNLLQSAEQIMRGSQYRKNSNEFYDNHSLTSFKGHSKTITAEALSEDNTYLVLADEDLVITVWDLIGCRRMASFIEHTGLIRALIITTGGLVISASNDKSIGVWNINRKENEQVKRLQGHKGPVLALALSSDESSLISSSDDQTLILWDLGKRQMKRKYYTKPDVFSALYMIHYNKNGLYKNAELQLTFLAGGRERILKLCTVDEGEPDIQLSSLMFLDSAIEMITMSPNQNILAMFLSSHQMQIWDFRSHTLMTLISEFDCPQTRSKPAFLSNTENRMLLYFNKLIDCFTGAVIFSFQPRQEILSFFFNFKSQYYLYITPDLELFQFNVNWLNSYLFKYLNYDSLTVMVKDPDIICDRKMSSYPFFFNFLHLISIFDKSELFTKEKLKEIYADEPDNIFSTFHSLDLFLNTPLDILVQRKNPTLIVKYFKLLFMFFKEKTTNFYEKSRFFTYNFREDYSLVSLLVDLTSLLGDDTAIFHEMFNLALMPLAPSIYDNSLIYKELEDPVYIETDNLYINDKKFIEEQLTLQLKRQADTDYDILPDDIEENKCMVKARIIVLPDLNEINVTKTNDFYGIIGNFQANNEFFSNKTLDILVDFIWRTQISFYYKIELCVFLVFFSLFNINFLFLYQMRVNIYNYENEAYNDACNIIDVLIILNSLYTMTNELQQLSQGINQYFKYIWNYFDIALIPLAMTAAVMDIMLIQVESFRENVPLIKTIFSVSMFCLWFRFLSFFRALKETSFMIRLIFNVLVGVKNFILFMVIFIMNMACSFYLLHSDNAGEIPSLWDTILTFYYTVMGDTSEITDYDLIITEFADFYMIASSFLFSVMLMNLLVSIISDFHADIKDSEQKTRLYEKMNILCDTNSSLTTNIAKKFFPPKKIGTFLIELYNEKHEQEERDKMGDLQKNIGTDVERMLNVTNEKIEELRKDLNGFEKETTHLIEELTEEVREKLNSLEKEKKSLMEALKEERRREFEEIMREIKEVKQIFGK